MTGSPVPVAFIRHGSTLWNEEKRIQGRMGTSLSPAGRAWVSTWKIPPEFADFTWFVSPKKRAIETAHLLGLAPEIEPNLAEMSWGDWEGHRLEDLRADFGEDVAANERRGLDFRPPEGESPRDVQGRVETWLATVAREGKPAGVIRAVYSLASGWDMTGKPPVKLKDGVLQLFTLNADGIPRVDRLNIPLETG